MSNTVWVVGGINDDTTLHVRSYPRSGRRVTARLDGSDLGGKGANQAIALARADASVRFVGAVGADDAGARSRQILSAERIDTTGLVEASESTGRAIVLLDDDGSNTIVIVPGANGALPGDDVLRGLSGAAAGDVLLAQLETSPESLDVALAHAARTGVQTVVNAAPFDERVLRLLDVIDVLVVNEHELDDASEALQLTGDRQGNAQTIAQQFDTTVVCTLGADGSFAATANGVVEVAGEVVDAVDTTGAGDAYIGYLVAGLASGGALQHSMERATRAAAIAVTRTGAARAIPTADEVASPTH